MQAEPVHIDVARSFQGRVMAGLKACTTPEGDLTGVAHSTEA